MWCFEENSINQIENGEASFLFFVLLTKKEVVPKKEANQVQSVTDNTCLQLETSSVESDKIAHSQSQSRRLTFYFNKQNFFFNLLKKTFDIKQGRSSLILRVRTTTRK